MPEFTSPCDPAAIEALASQLWGQPNRTLSTRDDLRFGKNGSKSVKPRRGVWFDHEASEGGHYRDLYRLANGTYPENGSDKSGFQVPIAMLRNLGNPVAWWDYQDDEGQVVGRVVRFEPTGENKTFRQCRPYGGAGWVWKMNGLALPLYRLPSLKAAPPGSLVYVTEGEKHADQLREWGLIATSNPGGAGKFRSDHAKALAGFRVAVLEDNDEAGRKHVAIVLRELRAAGVGARVVNLPGLPEKGDVVDWIKAGGTADELAALTADAWRPRLEQPQVRPLLEVLTPSQISEEQARPYVVKGLIARGDHVIAMGHPGSGKSVLIPHIAYAVAQGTGMVCGRRVKGGPVIYVAAEDGHGMKNRVRALLRRYGDAPDFHLVPMAVDLTADSPARQALEALIAKIEPVLIVVDTIGRAFPGLRENDSDDMGRVVRTVRELAGICQAAAISVHHVAKDAGTTPRGHGCLNADADITMLIEGSGTDTRTVKLGKNRNGPSDLTFAFSIEVDELGLDEDGDPITTPVAGEAEVESDTGSARREGKLADKPALLLAALRNMDPLQSTSLRPQPDMPMVQAIRRESLRDALIAQGWFPESVLCDALHGKKLARSGYPIEQNSLISLKRKGFISFNRDCLWLL